MAQPTRRQVPYPHDRIIITAESTTCGGDERGLVSGQDQRGDAAGVPLQLVAEPA